MLLDLHDDIDFHGHIEAFAGNVQGLMDRRLLALLEFHIDCRTDDL